MQTTAVPGKVPTVLVLGGSGFIGRHAVAALLAEGRRVIVGSRHPERIDRKLPQVAAGSPRRRIRMENLLDAAQWRPLLADVDAVLNCVGILRQRGAETYERVHHLAPAALAAACRERGIPFVHVSALGLEHPARSRFLRSKRVGEAAIRRSGADWRIVRPSLLDGDGGYGALWIRRVARWPLLALPGNALGRIAVLDVGELGEALARLALLPLPQDASDERRQFELGGDEAMTIEALLATMHRRHSTRPAVCLRLPAWLARLGSHACDLLHATPYSFGHYELLRNDNCPRENRLPELLGRRPRCVIPDEGIAGVQTLPA
ncbi:NAD(P)H-binding protein [Arenimonas sp.]|uniref:NAD(P)H-binding protein n=1 Tax=Arenimonas sp. TaxID=1872635 RepID=UPI0039E61439